MVPIHGICGQVMCQSRWFDDNHSTSKRKQDEGRNAEDTRTGRQGRPVAGLLFVQVLSGPAKILSDWYIMCRFRISRYAPGWAKEKEPESFYGMNSMEHAMRSLRIIA